MQPEKNQYIGPKITLTDAPVDLSQRRNKRPQDIPANKERSDTYM